MKQCKCTHCKQWFQIKDVILTPGYGWLCIPDYRKLRQEAIEMLIGGPTGPTGLVGDVGHYGGPVFIHFSEPPIDPADTKPLTPQHPIPPDPEPDVNTDLDPDLPQYCVEHEWIDTCYCVHCGEKQQDCG